MSHVAPETVTVRAAAEGTTPLSNVYVKNCPAVALMLTGKEEEKMLTAELLTTTRTRVTATLPNTSVAVTAIVKEVLVVLGVPANVKVLGSNVSQVPVVLAVTDEMLAAAAATPSSFRLPVGTLYEKAVPGVAFCVTDGVSNDKLCAPTTMLNVALMPAKPGKSVPTSTNSKYCGGAILDKTGGVVPLKAMFAASNWIQDGRGVWLSDVP